MGGWVFLTVLVLLSLGCGFAVHRHRRRIALVDRQGQILAERLFGPTSDP